MSIEVRRVEAEDVRTFATWRYDEPYDVYDITGDVDENVAYFLDAEVRCHVLVEGGELIGFCTFGGDAQVPGGSYEEDAIDMGLGVDPARIGAGRGSSFVGAVSSHASEAFPGRRQRVTIAAWNERALIVWRRQGFGEVARFTSKDAVMGSRDFVILASP